MSWGLGAFAGGLHALTGPDHLAVLLPSCIGVPWSQAYKSGAFWGLGHGIGATMFGLAGFAFRDWLNIEAASRFLEPVIGITLVVIAFQGQIGMGMLCSRSSRRAEMREVKVFLLEKDEEKGGKEDAEVEESIEIADDTVIGGRRRYVLESCVEDGESVYRGFPATTLPTKQKCRHGCDLKKYLLDFVTAAIHTHQP
ncbi:unnamed protein product [Choristocarpus tenellus]